MNDIYIDNEFPSISELDNPWRTHFGVVPEYVHINDRRRPIIDCGFNEDGSPRRHDDPSMETMLWRAPGVTAWVSGSWKCWGEQDQETRGDQSLHVVVFTPERPTNQQLDDFYEALRMDVQDGEGVVVEHAFITRRADSEVFSVVTFDSSHRSMIWDVKDSEETSVAEDAAQILDNVVSPRQVDLVVGSLVGASAVSQGLKKTISVYGFATINDLATLLHVPTKHDHEKWGWYDLSELTMKPDRFGIRFVFPPAVRLP